MVLTVANIHSVVHTVYGRTDCRTQENFDIPCLSAVRWNLIIYFQCQPARSHSSSHSRIIWDDKICPHVLQEHDVALLVDRDRFRWL